MQPLLDGIINTISQVQHICCVNEAILETIENGDYVIRLGRHSIIAFFQNIASKTT